MYSQVLVGDEETIEWHGLSSHTHRRARDVFAHSGNLGQKLEELLPGTRKDSLRTEASGQPSSGPDGVWLSLVDGTGWGLTRSQQLGLAELAASSSLLCSGAPNTIVSVSSPRALAYSKGPQPPASNA